MKRPSPPRGRAQMRSRNHSRLHLELLEQRLPPGSILGLSPWSGMEAYPSLLDAQAVPESAAQAAQPRPTRPSGDDANRRTDTLPDSASQTEQPSLVEDHETPSPAGLDPFSSALIESLGETDDLDLTVGTLARRTNLLLPSAGIPTAPAAGLPATGSAPRSPAPVGDPSSPVRSSERGMRNDERALLLTPHSAFRAPHSADPAAETPAQADVFGRLPLSFEINQGQAEAPVDFLSRGSGYSLFLSGGEATLTLQRPAADEGPTPEATSLRMRLIGANPEPQAVGLEQLPGKVNYLVGSDPAQWRTDVSTFARVEYQEVYPGINLVYYGTSQRQLEYDFVIAPGADPDAIALRFEGAQRAAIDGAGDLVLDTAGGEVRQHRPVVHQMVDGARQEMAGSYVLLDSAGAAPEVGFRLGDYHHGLPLVIDPVLSYSSYLGRAGTDGALGIAVGADRSVYLAGETTSNNLPTTTGAYQTTYQSGQSDAFVAKISATGTLVYLTYLGGSGGEGMLGDRASAIAVDATGNAYVTGRTSSADFPTTSGALQILFSVGNGDYDGFVTKLNPTGSGLVWSTFLGGTENDAGIGIALGPGNTVYVVGGSGSTEYPTSPGAYQPSNLGTDAILTVLNATATGLVYSTFLGGSFSMDRANAVAVDAAGNAYVAGQTISEDFPIKAALRPTYGGATDGFIARFNPSASGEASLIFSTYLGGSAPDRAMGIALGPAGHIYVAGVTSSDVNFPLTAALQSSFAGGVTDGFVSKINAAGSTFVYSTFLGGSGDDHATAVAVTIGDQATVTGGTLSSNFPTRNASQVMSGGDSDAFVTRYNPAGSAYVYSTFLGGADAENPAGSVGGTGGGADYGSLALDAGGNAYVAGRTQSSNFPTLSPFQAASGGGADTFVTRLVPGGTLVLGGDIGSPPFVLALDQTTFVVKHSFAPFIGTYTGGVHLAAGDLTGDGKPEILTATGVGIAAELRIYDGASTGMTPTLLLAVPLAGLFPDGLFVAAGDISGDGIADLVVAPDRAQLPFYLAINSATGASIALNLAYEATFTNGVRVAVGDVDRDGRGDIITVPGPGRLGEVKVFSGATGAMIRSYTAFAGYTGGLTVAAGDTNGDGKADIAVGQDVGSGGGSQLRLFDSAANGGTPTPLATITPAPGFTGPVRVAVADVDRDGLGEVFARPGWFLTSGASA